METYVYLQHLAQFILEEKMFQKKTIQKIPHILSHNTACTVHIYQVIICKLIQHYAHKIFKNSYTVKPHSNIFR